ncbi:MAG: flagellar hook protein FlgE [Kofleriaceae bacterium]
MSITNSLYIGISGLIAHGDAISVVGDNIANASTVGFKRARASFSDLLGGELGAQRMGGGVRLGASQTMYDQGAITQTGNPLDVAISGDGMFVVKGNHGGHPGQFYTRDGRFSLDNQGFAVDPRGLRVQGYTINNGVKANNIGDLALGSRTSPPIATASAKMAFHLDSSTPANPVPFDPANPDATSDYATSITVKDSLGKDHHVDMYMRSNGGGGWEWHAMVDGGEVGGTAGTPQEIGSGSLAFNTDGTLQSQTVNASSVQFTGAAPQTIAYNFGDDIASGGTGNDGTTQTAGPNSVNSLDIDGRSGGTITDLVINDDGTVDGVFDNGDRFQIAQLAIAEFANQEGLERAGDGLLTETTASGQALIDVPGSGARGSLVSGALEASNVDLGTELVTLIAYQRAFQANAKTITTADEMMADVNNLKR